MNATYAQNFKESNFEATNERLYASEGPSNLTHVAKEHQRKVRLPDIGNLSFSTEIGEGLNANLSNIQFDPYSLRGKS